MGLCRRKREVRRRGCECIGESSASREHDRCYTSVPSAARTATLMNWNRLRQNRLLLQLLFPLVAAASLAAISILVITDAIRSAESVVIGEKA
jgi:hypothetical protein